jgi:ribosomal protein S18 acetylase RimI-like enzyme
MARSTETESPPGVEVIEAGPDLFTEVMCEGWGAPVGAMADYNRACTADARFGFFVAKLDGAPAGAGGAVFFERSVYLLGGVVLPRFRRRGVYRALTDARLRAAQARGLQLATTRAMADTSVPLLEQQGWDSWYRFPSFSPIREVGQ